MLDLARIQRGCLELSEKAVDLAGELSGAVRIMADAAARRRMRMVTTVDADLPAVRGDARLIRQILLNLISNAVKYGDEDSVVTLDLQRSEEGAICVSVENSGEGMCREEIEAAFLPFMRLRAANEASVRGSGLGLPLSRALAELHGGSLVLESENGGVIRSMLTLPAARVAAPPRSAQRAFRFSLEATSRAPAQRSSRR